MPNVLETATRFRGQLANQETQASNDLIAAYRGVVNRLEDKLSVLMTKIEQLEAQGNLTPEQVRKQAVWSSLLQQMETGIAKYGGYVSTQNTVAAQKAIDLAGKHSQLLTQTYFNDNPALVKAFNASWDRLPNESVETLLSFLQPDSELNQRLNNSLGSSGASNFQNKLLEGIALGYNPKKINQLINQSLGEPLTWSLNSVRTTQNYAYRESTRANYLNNTEILNGWKWFAALDGRVCLSCVNQHGKTFTLEQRLNDHHQGRCTQIPMLDKPERFGLQAPEIQLGEQWFNQLSKAEQISRMGQERYQAYKQGKFKFGDLSQPYQNDTFGEMLKEASLKSLLSKPKAIKKSVEAVKSVVSQLVKQTKDIFKIAPDLADKNKPLVETALKYIDKVHAFDSSARTVPIQNLSGMSEGTQGVYDVAKKIVKLKPNSFTPLQTTLHEIGHYIDYTLLGFGQSVTENDQQLDEWRKAVSNSKAYKKLVDMAFNPDKYELDFGWAGKVKPEVTYTSYLMQLDECFARSYAQYILTKVGKNSLFDETRQDQLYGAKQWEEQDFKPIEQAFDKLFEGLKWQVPKN